jgi:ribosome maturation factor RimP
MAMGNESIAARVQELAERVAIDHGLELVHTEVAGPENKPIVRIFIDKPNGVTHEDCSEVSTHLGTILDVEDFIHAAYTLEVSSPGLERGLYKRADFERFAGSQLRGSAIFGGVCWVWRGTTCFLKIELTGRCVFLWI